MGWLSQEEDPQVAISINTFGWGLTAFKGTDQSCAFEVGTAVTHHISEEKEIDCDLIKH